MGTVAVTLRILPADAEVDIEGLKAAVRDALGDSLRDLGERPVAFGIRAIEAIALVDDAAGGSDALERSLADVPGIGTVETIDVTLV
jgi:translation elongation factor aEF-1 beta